MATIVFRTDKGSEITLEFNTEKHIPGGHIHIAAGGSSSNSGSAVFEADKGYVILGFEPLIQSQWGESGYTTSLLGRDANFEKIEKINEVMEGLIQRAQEGDKKSTSEMVQWARKYLLDYYQKVTSSNAHFEVHAYANSREIKLGPVVVDTKTANIQMSFTFHVIKLITPEEFQMLGQFFYDAIVQGANIERTFIE